ncbi:MAG: SemiSWEET transporter [Patescibacteria group bacterium]
MVEFLGFVSGALATFAFVPQVIRVWKMKPAPATAISLPMYAVFCLGVLGWLFYGILIGSLPVMVWNIITFMLALSVLLYKKIYG